MYLYELDQKLEQVLKGISETGEVNDYQAELMEAIHDNTDPCLEYIIKKVNELKAEQASLKGQKEYYAKELKRVNASLKVKNDKITYYMDTMGNVLHNLGENTRKVGNFVLKFTKVNAPLEIDDDAIVPPEFIKTVESFDKVLIKQALKEGLELEGVRVPVVQKLRIK